MTIDRLSPAGAQQAESLAELQANLSKALQLLTTAVDQSLKLSEAGPLKRIIAKEWEVAANKLISHVKSQAQTDNRNLLSWLALINLKL